MKNKNQLFTSNIINELLFILVLLLIFFTNIYAQNEAIIDMDSTHQIIRGFGGANILNWRPDMTVDEIDNAFGTDEGQIGLTILRLRIPPNENYFDDNIQTALTAHYYGVKIIASPWSPPAWMKTNNSVVGGRLLEAYYADYAEHLESFVDLMESNDIPIYAVSVQNEPDADVDYESCYWNTSEMLKFVKENAPTIGADIIVPESESFDKTISNAILNDSEAAENVSIIGGHIYGGGLEPYPLAESKGKEVWMTEHLSGEDNSGNDWSWAFIVATEINNIMNAGMNAYIWWYIVRYYGLISDGTNNSGNKGDVTKKGYVMSQFARFIRPGYFRIQCDKRPQSQVYTSAYKDSTSSKVVIVAINTSFQAKNQTFTFQNGKVEKFTPYVTSETKNCDRENDILVSNNSLSTTLDARSITTFMSSGNVTVAVENSSYSPVSSFKLFQNYPNPFNPTTTIEFNLPRASEVTLKVFTILGEEVATLISDRLTAGSYSYEWSPPAGLASGIYLYKLEAVDLSRSAEQSFVETKKMVLIK